jgi:hypothetical protein
MKIKVFLLIIFLVIFFKPLFSKKVCNCHDDVDENQKKPCCQRLENIGITLAAIYLNEYQNLYKLIHSVSKQNNIDLSFVGYIKKQIDNSKLANYLKENLNKECLHRYNFLKFLEFVNLVDNLSDAKLLKQQIINEIDISDLYKKQLLNKINDIIYNLVINETNI